jgi:hypothetical protein
MFTAEILSPSELFVEPASELTRLFWEGYRGKVASELHDPDERITRAIGLRHATGVLAAAVLLERSRMAAITTVPAQVLGSRFLIGRELLRVAYDDGVAAWISIGEKNRNVQNLVESVSMQRIDDPETIAVLFNDLERPKDYKY